MQFSMFPFIRLQNSPKHYGMNGFNTKKYMKYRYSRNYSWSNYRMLSIKVGIYIRIQEWWYTTRSGTPWNLTNETPTNIKEHKCHPYQYQTDNQHRNLGHKGGIGKNVDSNLSSSTESFFRNVCSSRSPPTPTPILWQQPHSFSPAFSATLTDDAHFCRFCFWRQPPNHPVSNHCTAVPGKASKRVRKDLALYS